MTAIRIGLVGLGTIGSHITRLLLDYRHGFEIVGATTLDTDMHGKRLHEAVEAKTPSDVVVTGTISDVLRRGPDIVLHATQSFLKDIADQVLACIDSGANVISCAEELAYPWRRDPELARKLNEAAIVADVTVVGSGVNPGFLFDSLLTKVTGICWNVDNIVGRRVVDVSGFGKEIHERLGIGYTLGEFERGHEQGTIAGHVGFPESIALVFQAMGLSLDGEVEETFEPLIAPDDVTTKYGVVEAGETEGFIQRAIGRWQGQDYIQLELVLHLQPEARGFALEDTIRIEGKQPVNLSLTPGPSALLSTSANIVNSIPSVLAAPPGMRNVTELTPPAVWLRGLDRVGSERQ